MLTLFSFSEHHFLDLYVSRSGHSSHVTSPKGLYEIIQKNGQDRVSRELAPSNRSVHVSH